MPFHVAPDGKEVGLQSISCHQQWLIAMSAFTVLHMQSVKMPCLHADGQDPEEQGHLGPSGYAEGKPAPQQAMSVLLLLRLRGLGGQRAPLPWQAWRQGLLCTHSQKVMLMR